MKKTVYDDLSRSYQDPFYLFKDSGFGDKGSFIAF